MKENMNYTTIAQIPDDHQLITDSQDVDQVKNQLGFQSHEFDAFFVRVSDGDYDSVYGFNGMVPLLTKQAVQLIEQAPQVEAEMSQLGGDTSHARTFGRLDAALGEHPIRFVNGPDELQIAYLDGYHTTLGKLETTCTPKAKFRNEFPWHKSNGTIDQINKAAL